MSIQVSLLSKRNGAVVNGAPEGFFLGMCSQVVVELAQIMVDYSTRVVVSLVDEKAFDESPERLLLGPVLDDEESVVVAPWDWRSEPKIL